MSEDTLNPLREITNGGGLGFCYDTDRTMFRAADRADGPLVVALDGNLVIDTVEYGALLLDDEPLPATIAADYAAELEAWATVIDVWMLRDIRFIPLPALQTDARRNPTDEHRALKSDAIAGVAEALAFQIDDWESVVSDLAPVRNIEDETRAAVERGLSSLDARLFIEAAVMDVDVFLTRDRRIRNRIADLDIGALPNAWSPSQLAGRLDALDVGHLGGGNLDHPGCAYSHDALMPDIGKWAGLFAAMGL